MDDQDTPLSEQLLQEAAVVRKMGRESESSVRRRSELYERAAKLAQLQETAVRRAKEVADSLSVRPKNMNTWATSDLEAHMVLVERFEKSVEALMAFR